MILRYIRTMRRRIPPKYSIVVCSIDQSRFRAVQNNYIELFSRATIEIIHISDARSLCEGYNRGFKKARGEYVIFSHDDIRIITPDFEERLNQHLECFDVVGVAGTTHVIGGAWFLAGHPHDYQFVTSPEPGTDDFVMVVRGGGRMIVPDIQALDGLFFACRRSVVATVGFDEETFDGFHGYDIDFTYRAYLAGFKLAVCRDLFIIHYSHGHFDHVWDAYRRRFEQKHGMRSAPDQPRPANVVAVQLGRHFVEDTNYHAELSSPATVSHLIARADEYRGSLET